MAAFYEEQNFLTENTHQVCNYTCCIKNKFGCVFFCFLFFFGLQPAVSLYLLEMTWPKNVDLNTFFANAVQHMCEPKRCKCESVKRYEEFALPQMERPGSFPFYLGFPHCVLFAFFFF